MILSKGGICLHSFSSEACLASSREARRASSASISNRFATRSCSSRLASSARACSRRFFSPKESVFSSSWALSIRVSETRASRSLLSSCQASSFCLSCSSLSCSSFRRSAFCSCWRVLFSSIRLCSSKISFVSCAMNNSRKSFPY